MKKGCREGRVKKKWNNSTSNASKARSRWGCLNIDSFRLKFHEIMRRTTEEAPVRIFGKFQVGRPPPAPSTKCDVRTCVCGHPHEYDRMCEFTHNITDTCTSTLEQTDHSCTLLRVILQRVGTVGFTWPCKIVLTVHCRKAWCGKKISITRNDI